MQIFTKHSSDTRWIFFLSSLLSGMKVKFPWTLHRILQSLSLFFFYSPSHCCHWCLHSTRLSVHTVDAHSLATVLGTLASADSHCLNSNLEVSSVQRRCSAEFGCNQRLFDSLSPLCGLQAVSLLRPLTPDTNKTFSSTQLLLAGYFLFLAPFSVNSRRRLRRGENPRGSAVRLAPTTMFNFYLIKWPVCVCMRVCVCQCDFYLNPPASHFQTCCPAA